MSTFLPIPHFWLFLVVGRHLPTLADERVREDGGMIQIIFQSSFSWGDMEHCTVFRVKMGKPVKTYGLQNQSDEKPVVLDKL
jgi:hypothetical protein